MSVSKYLSQIRFLQLGGTQPFPPSLFPTYRNNPSLGYRRADTNLFFSVISAFTLQSLKKELYESADVSIAETIINDTQKTYELFRNKDGFPTYNFWPTNPSQHFSNGYLLSKLEHFRIADDADDTVMVYMTSERSYDDCLWLKNKLIEHANSSKTWIKHTYPEYKTLRAYSTWFGKHMQNEFDACVLSNILYFVFEKQLPLCIQDQDSLTYIRSIIETGRYKTNPFECAHHYPKTTLIIYHVGRLIAKFNPSELESIKEELITTSYNLLQTPLHPLDRVILSTTLLRLGESPEEICTDELTTNDFKGFWFFIAGLLTACESTFLYKLAPYSVFHMYWECEAHCWLLLAEYEVIKGLKNNALH